MGGRDTGEHIMTRNYTEANMTENAFSAFAPEKQGLYDPRHEHDACGLGFVAHIKNEKSHRIIRDGLTILENLEHRGAVGADPLAGDGCGILIQIPDLFLRKEAEKEGFNIPELGAYGVAMVLRRCYGLFPKRCGNA